MNASKIIGTVLVAGMLSGCSLMGDKYSVYFDTGSHKVSMADKAKLKKIAKLAKQEEKKVKIVAYTDNTGSKKMNKKISKNRIATVSKELKRWGLDKEEFSMSARGEGWFDTNGKADREQRRVEIRLY